MSEDQKKHHAAFAREMKEASECLKLAQIYSEDGALLTAADKFELVGSHLRRAHQHRCDYIGNVPFKEEAGK